MRLLLLSLLLLAASEKPAPLAMKVPAPEFKEVEEWVNSKPLDWKALKGKVTVVHFWAFGCINCIRNYPHYKAWHDDFKKKDLVIVGVHTPETAAERKLESVKEKVKANKMAYPVAVDGAGKTWAAWDNRYWPAVYLVDKKGLVRYRWYGELNFNGAKGEAAMREKIEELLA
jgi:thiol-disulfide isomerase/thioredoxin